MWGWLRVLLCLSWLVEEWSVYHFVTEFFLHDISKPETYTPQLHSYCGADSLGHCPPLIVETPAKVKTMK